MNTFLRMPQGGTTIPVFIDEKSKHRNTTFSRLRSHIFLWNNQEQNVPFESSASILNAIFLFLAAVVRKDMWAEWKGRKNQMVETTGNIHWFQNIPDRSCWLFFLVFKSCACTPTVATACCLIWSTGECCFQGQLCCICMEGWPCYKSRLTPPEFVESWSGYQ